MDMDIDTEVSDEKIVCQSSSEPETINDNDADINVSKDENKINNQAVDESSVVKESVTRTSSSTEEPSSLDENHSASNNLTIDTEDINYDDQDIEKSLAEMERADADDEKNYEIIKSTVLNEEKNAPIPIPMEKRKYSESKWTSDDEGFAGFDDSSGKLFLVLFRY